MLLLASFIANLFLIQCRFDAKEIIDTSLLLTKNYETIEK